MSYEPWPDEGCTLAEARERTANRAAWREFQRRREHYKSLGPGVTVSDGYSLSQIRDDDRARERLRSGIEELAQSIDTEFRSFFTKRRLIAYGRRNDLSATPELIGPDIWPALQVMNYDASAVGENRHGGTAFLAVHVFPVLKAPCRLDLLSGKTLADAFQTFVLADPEVAALAKVAIEDAPEFERVFVHGHCFVRGCREWPLAKGHAITGVVHQDQARRTAIGGLADPDPQSASDAADALTDRFDALFDRLRDGKLMARAIRADNGNQETILSSIWSHSDFWLDAREGDILQVNPDCEEPPRDFLRPRWVGALLARGDKESRQSDPSFQSNPVHRTPVPEAPFTPEDVVAAGSFGPALERLILHHPVVENLRPAARMASQRHLCPLYEDAGLLTPCYGHDEPLLPIKVAAREKLENMLTEDELADISGVFRSRIPSEISRLYHTINLHIWWFFEYLRQQRVLVFAHTTQGDRIPINHTIWSHDAYYILPRASDIFEARPLRMIRRWVGATFEQAAASRATATQPVRLPTEPKSVERAASTILAIRECVKWLSGEMEKSPHQRTATKDKFWKEASNRWTKRLSRRGFNGAWAEAIRQTGAVAWAAGGAPKKDKKNPRTDNPCTK